MKLREWLPQEALGGEYVNDRHMKFLDHEIIAEYTIAQNKMFKSWPGHEKNVLHWCIIKTGQCIGWNENPSKGWSFPVTPAKVGKSLVDIKDTF